MECTEWLSGDRADIKKMYQLRIHKQGTDIELEQFSLSSKGDQNVLTCSHSYQQLFTIHVFADGKLVPVVYCLCTDKHIGTYRFIFQALISRAVALEIDLNQEAIICDFETALIPPIRWKVGDLGLKTRYRSDEETKRKMIMLLATAFLNVPQVDTGVSLLEAGTTGNLLTLFQYFRQEWVTNERLPLWNVRNVNIRTNNHLESWHNGLNKKAGGIKLILFSMIHFLKEEKGVMETLINQVLLRILPLVPLDKKTITNRSRKILIIEEFRRHNQCHYVITALY
ncbi:conserved hypothetical protein [Trichinella spiralis]|uniref:hypothetical protein n=1 Tax=Trichinella spiralis TaxID=6334 RepID=UPI0001EFC57E|nr:conserved hypothetical protein [Trichinella spiralis]